MEQQPRQNGSSKEFDPLPTIAHPNLLDQAASEQGVQLTWVQLLTNSNYWDGGKVGKHSSNI
jgi:hypothetical protein